MPTHQFSFDLIIHQVQDAPIQQRASDGYINASQLCAAAGRKFHQYQMLEQTGHFIRALAQKLGVPKESLMINASNPAGESIWVHPQVAINLAQWLSADFAVLVSSWVYEWLSGKGRPAMPSYHLKRHMANYGKIPNTHFSILQEMTMTLIAPLESHGYALPDHMVPDISQGLMFAKFARTRLGVDTDTLPTYQHEYEDGRVVPAKLYPVEVLGEFRKFINEVWMPQRAGDYFKQRDPQALPFLDKVLKIAARPASPALPAPKKPKAA